MNKNFKQKLVTCVVMLMLVMCNVVNVAAASVSFDKAYVNGGSYSYITKINKATSFKYVELSITTMYTTNNKKAAYRKSKAQLRGWDAKEGEYVRCTISDDYGKTVKKGTTAKFKLLKDYQKKGKTIKYYAKGNDPDKDCKITGKMWVDQEN